MASGIFGIREAPAAKTLVANTRLYIAIPVAPATHNHRSEGFMVTSSRTTGLIV